MTDKNSSVSNMIIVNYLTKVWLMIDEYQNTRNKPLGDTIYASCARLNKLTEEYIHLFTDIECFCGELSENNKWTKALSKLIDLRTGEILE